MKVIGCWICYNNAMTIRHSIMSVAKHLDSIYVVDGSFDGKRSNDGTWEIVERIQEELSDSCKMGWNHTQSEGKTLYEKHQEHVNLTGNKDPNVWTWQVDSDEIYLPEHAVYVRAQIDSNKYNGIALKLVNINRIDEGIGYSNKSIIKSDTYQMRIYRMHNGLNFRTRDGIFEHIVYADGSPVQRQDNKIHYISTNDAVVFNYHCLEPFSSTIKRYRHYKEANPEEFARMVRSKEYNDVAINDHPLKDIYYRA